MDRHLLDMVVKGKEDMEVEAVEAAVEVGEEVDGVGDISWYRKTWGWRMTAYVWHWRWIWSNFKPLGGVVIAVVAWKLPLVGEIHDETISTLRSRLAQSPAIVVRQIFAHATYLLGSPNDRE